MDRDIAALEFARSRNARFFEFRAVTSRARLLRDEGRHDGARALVELVYRWFNEGFDSPVLRDAKALLAESS